MRSLARTEVRPVAEMTAYWEMPQVLRGEILIVGAGDGLLAKRLLQQRQRVHVLERELWAEGLDRAHRHAIAEGMLEMYLCDYTLFESERRFDTILWLSGDMATLPPGEQMAVLRCLEEHLVPGGRLVIDLPRNRSWGGENGYLPSIDRMIALGHNLDLGRLEVKLTHRDRDSGNIRYIYRDVAPVFARAERLAIEMPTTA